jgi:uncharacterized RDD family membrane protein YckC
LQPPVYDPEMSDLPPPPPGPLIPPTPSLPAMASPPPPQPGMPAPVVHVNVAAPTTSRPTLPPGVEITNPGMRLVAYLLEGVLVLITLGVGWLIWAAIIVGGGQTPAKKIMGQRVISADGRGPVGFGTMFFLRGIIAPFVAFFAIMFTLGVLLFMPLWDKRNQNIWDKVSGCLVVDDRDNAWGLQ